VVFVRKPLHVAAVVAAAGAQRIPVIHLVARARAARFAGARTGVFGAERTHFGARALDRLRSRGRGN
jgi:hypothetical protein